MTSRDYVLFTGQSLSIGFPNDGIHLDTRGAQGSPSNIQRLLLNGTLTANQLPDETAQPTDTKPARSFGNDAWAGGSAHLVVNTHGVSSQDYVALKKGTSCYTGATSTVTNGVAANVGDTFIPRSLHIVHGEADSTGGTSRATYVADLAEWLSDYNTDLKAITGSTVDMNAFLCQMTYFGPTNIALAQVDAARSNPRTYLVCPKYQFGATSHLNAIDYDHLGSYHAKAYRKVIANGAHWWPVMPKVGRSIATRQTITIDFEVPVPPLVFDTTTLSAKAAMGFVVADDNGTKTISNVAITGPTQVQLVVSTQLGPNPTVQYGSNGSGGNLRDSDPEISVVDSYPLWNWAVMFKENVIFGGQAARQKARYAVRGGIAF